MLDRRQEGNLTRSSSLGEGESIVVVGDCQHFFFAIGPCSFHEARKRLAATRLAWQKKFLAARARLPRGGKLVEKVQPSRSNARKTAQVSVA